MTEFLDENLAKDTTCNFILLIEGQGCDNMTAILIIF